MTHPYSILLKNNNVIKNYTIISRSHFNIFYCVPSAVKYNIKVVAKYFEKGLEPAWVYYYGMHWFRNSWQECKNKSLLILWDDFKQKSRKFFWKISKPLVIVLCSFFPKENTKYISMLINHILLHPLQLVFPNSKQPYKVNKNKKVLYNPFIIYIYNIMFVGLFLFYFCICFSFLFPCRNTFLFLYRCEWCVLSTDI